MSEHDPPHDPYEPRAGDDAPRPKRALKVLPWPPDDDAPSADTAPELVRVASASSIPEGRAKVVFVGSVRVALFKVKGALYAVKNACPHAGAPLSGGACRGALVTCPRHGWTFDLTTGACLTQPLYQLTKLPLKVEDGDVWVGLPPA